MAILPMMIMAGDIRALAWTCGTWQPLAECRVKLARKMFCLQPQPISGKRQRVGMLELDVKASLREQDLLVIPSCGHHPFSLLVRLLQGPIHSVAVSEE